jgi:hypothetical protein
MVGSGTRKRLQQIYFFSLFAPRHSEFGSTTYVCRKPSFRDCESRMVFSPPGPSDTKNPVPNADPSVTDTYASITTMADG